MYKSTARYLSHHGKGDFSSKVIVKFDSGRKVPKDVKAASENGEHLKGHILQRVKGGFTVRLSNIEAFCPFSEFPKYLLEAEIYELIRKRTKLDFKVLRAESASSIIVSRKIALKETGMACAQQALATGVAIEGDVTDILPVGAFIDIGGVQGLLHKSKCPIATPLRKCVKFRVRVVAIGDGGKRITLASARVADIIR